MSHITDDGVPYCAKHGTFQCEICEPKQPPKERNVTRLHVGEAQFGELEAIDDGVAEQLAAIVERLDTKGRAMSDRYRIVIENDPQTCRHGMRIAIKPSRSFIYIWSSTPKR